MPDRVHRRTPRIALVALAASLPAACIVAFAQDPTPARVGMTAACYYPGTIALTWHAPDGVGATILRRVGDEPETELAKAAAGVRHHYDTGLAADAVYGYWVTLDDGTELGPVAAANSAEMLIGGDLEDQPPGPTTSTLAFHRAYGEPWWTVVEEIRPDSTGARSIRIKPGRPPRRDGLHSKLLPIDPRASYRQSGWARVLPGSNARIGRQMLTTDLKPAGGRIVPYSYAPVKLEDDSGWQYFEQRLGELSDDAAYVQVWALAFETRNTVWFDDLSLIDERTERLAAFDSTKALDELSTLAEASGDDDALKQVARLADTVGRVESALRDPGRMPLGQYLDLVDELDRAVRDTSELTWDLKILNLAK